LERIEGFYDEASNRLALFQSSVHVFLPKACIIENRLVRTYNVEH